MKEKIQVSNKKTLIFLAVIIVILAFGNIAAFFYYIPKKINSAASGDSYNFLNPARKFFKPEDLIINFQPLRDYLNNKYAADLNVSVYFEYLPTGSNIAINKNAEFYPASLLKVPVAMAVAKKKERGDWKWSNELVLMPADKDDRFGTLYKESSNSKHTIENVVGRSLLDSDNTAHFMLVRNLEIEEIEDVYEHIGLKDFLSSSGNLSAKRYSVIMRALYNSSYLSEENSQKLLSYLSRSPFKEYIESGLPQGVVFSHKIGIDKDKDVFLDSGIVHAERRPYLLTVMIKTKDEQRAKEEMKDISENVFNYVKNYHD